MKATRDSFGNALRKLGEENKKIVVLDADLSVSTKSAVFGQAFPDRFFQMGIAEANMIGTAAGLSFTGLIPFACSFGCFLAGRYETIRVSVGYSNANVKLVGTHAGLGTGEDGYTQMGLEDIGVLRSLPGITLLQPCDDVTTQAIVRFATEHDGPVYLRLTRQKLPDIHKSPDVFKWGKGIVIKEGQKIALLGTGATVAEILEASKQLNNPWVIDMPTLKPIDFDLIKHLGKICEQIVTVEDHNIIGGLGSAVAEVLAETQSHARLKRIGVKDIYGESGDSKSLYDKYGLSAKKIVEALL